MNLNPRMARWQGGEFFAFPGLRLGRKTNWAESLCFLPSRMAAWVGAPVALQQSRTLRPGTYTIARPAIDFYPVVNLNKSQWTFHPRKSGHFKPRFCGLFVPLLTTDYVAIESITNAWYVYALLKPQAKKVLAANQIKVKQIALARVKTDICDTLILAQLLAANMIPSIWVPPLRVRKLRYLLSQRHQFSSVGTLFVGFHVELLSSSMTTEGTANGIAVYQ